MTNRAAVETFVSQPAFALAGASRSGKKFGNLALRELLGKGYRVYPLHPAAASIDGVTCYARFADLPEPVEGVLIVLPPPQALAVVIEAAAAGIRRVWLQQGAASPEVLAACYGLGLEVVADECILMFARPTGYHKVHRWVWQMLGKLPA